MPPTPGHKSTCSMNGMVRKHMGKSGEVGWASYWPPKQSSMGSEHEGHQGTISQGLTLQTRVATPVQLLACCRSSLTPGGPGVHSQSTDRQRILTTNSKTRTQVPTGKCSLCVIRLKTKLLSHEMAGTIKPPLYETHAARCSVCPAETRDGTQHT